MGNELSHYLNSKKGDLKFEKGPDSILFTYDYNIRNGIYKPARGEFYLPHSDKDQLIYVFGSSPIVSKLFTQPDNVLFPARLQEKLNKTLSKNFKVYNFGISSFDSFEIKTLAREVIEYQRPDMIIYYEGHMDYEAAYSSVIKNRYFLLRNTFYKKLLFFFRLNNIKVISKAIEIGDWILRSSIEPRILNLLQACRLIAIDPLPFKEYNGLILEYYKENIYDIIEYSEKLGIPVIFITPIANLEVEPFGILRITSGYYEKGMREGSYPERIEYLTSARDSEIFSGDLRAKTGLYEFYNTLESPNVHVFDLQGKLYQQRFNFGYDYFYDAGHMKPRLHSLIAELLYEYMREKGLIR